MAEVEDSSEEDDIFLGTITSNKESTWTVTVCLQQKETQFKMDTGAEVTVSDKVYHTLPEVKLEKSTRALHGPAQQKLNVMGHFKGELTYGELTHTKSMSCESLPSITALKLIQQIDAAQAETLTVQEQYPKVFTGLGTMGDEYTIQLKKNAMP
jgi:hypothetical protein